MKIVNVGEVEEQKGGIFLIGNDQLIQALWFFFEEEKADSTKGKVESVMSKIQNQSIRLIKNYEISSASTLQIEIVDRKVGLYVMRIKKYNHFDIKRETNLANQMGKSLSIVNFLVKVEVEQPNKDSFAFDFGEILRRLRSIFPNLNMSADELSADVMRSYDHYSGKAVPFGFYQMGNILVSLTLGQEMGERRVVGGCPISEGEPKDTWKMSLDGPTIEGPFIPTTKEPLPCLRIFIGKIKIKGHEDFFPMILNEDIALAKSLAEKIAEAMKM